MVDSLITDLSVLNHVCSVLYLSPQPRDFWTCFAVVCRLTINQRKCEVGAICSVAAEYFEMRTFGVHLQMQGMGYGLWFTCEALFSNTCKFPSTDIKKDLDWYTLLRTRYMQVPYPWLSPVRRQSRDGIQREQVKMPRL